MASNETAAWTIVQEVFKDSLVFNIDWLIVIFIVFISMLLITRNIQKWKVLALPVTLAWSIAGLKPSLLWYIIITIIFGVESLSIDMLGSLVKAVSKPFVETGKIATKGIMKFRAKRLEKWADKMERKPIKSFRKTPITYSKSTLIKPSLDSRKKTVKLLKELRPEKQVQSIRKEATKARKGFEAIKKATGKVFNPKKLLSEEEIKKIRKRFFERRNRKF